MLKGAILSNELHKPIQKGFLSIFFLMMRGRTGFYESGLDACCSMIVVNCFQLTKY